MDTLELQLWLNTLKQIPIAKQRQRSLMDITGITHHENMWSDIYKFFFTTTEEHGLKDLFIKSLETLIGAPDFLPEFRIKREFIADENKRIDLLLYNKQNKKAIIIENKVYHTLNNDLNLYQRSLQRNGYQDIKTVVLGLHKYCLNGKKMNEIKATNLFSITHQELMECVNNYLPQYLSDANLYHLYLLKEFHKNINNITYMIDQSVIDFFSMADNREKIFKIHSIYENIVTYLTSVMECKKNSTLKETLTKQKLKIKPEGNFVKYIFPDTSDKVMLTVFYRDKIMHPADVQPHIRIILEVQGDVKIKVLADLENVKKLIHDFGNGKIKYVGKQRNHWLHFASQTIVLDNLAEQLPVLDNIVSEQIAENSAMTKLAKALIAYL